MSKRHIILASAVLSMSALVASCGGGGGGSAPQPQQAPATPPPATPPATPPPATPPATPQPGAVLGTVLIQVRGTTPDGSLLAGNWQRYVATIDTNGNYVDPTGREVRPAPEKVIVDAAAGRELRHIATCKNGNIVMTDATSSGIFVYRKATNDIVPATNSQPARGTYTIGAPTTNSPTIINENFVIINDTGVDNAAEGDLVFSCSTNAVEDLRLVDASNRDRIILTQNYVLYLNSITGAPDKVYIITPNRNITFIRQSVASGTGEDFSFIQVSNNPNAFILYDNGTPLNANPPMIVIRDDGTFSTGSISGVGSLAPTKIQQATAVQVGANIMVGLAAKNNAANDAEVVLMNGIGIIGVITAAGHLTAPVKLERPIAIDGVGNLFAVQSVSTNKIVAITPTGQKLGPTPVTAACTTYMIGVLDGVIVASLHTGTAGDVFAAVVGPAGIVKVTPPDAVKTALINIRESLQAVHRTDTVITNINPIYSTTLPPRVKMFSVVNNAGTNNVYAFSQGLAGANVFAFSSINAAQQRDADGEGTVVSGLAKDGYKAFVYDPMTHKAIYQDQSGGLILVTVAGGNITPKSITQDVFGLGFIGQKDLPQLRFTSDGVTGNMLRRVYTLPATPRATDKVNMVFIDFNTGDSKIYLIDLLPGTTAGVDAGYISTDGFMVVTQVAEDGSACARLKAYSKLVVARANNTKDPIQVKNPVVTATTPLLCVDRVLGVIR